MSLKNLFINPDETEEKNTVSVESPKSDKKISFPKDEPKSTTTKSWSGIFGSSTPAPVNTDVSQEHLDSAVANYQNGFNSLNQDGYDFFEFYQAVVHGGVENPQTYTMAYAMSSGMDKSLSKQKLLSQSDFYLNEINSVFNSNVAKGNAKKQELLNQKTNENKTLADDLDLMEQQLEALKTQIQDRKNKLEAIGSKYEPLINEINSKLTANELAKNQLTASIEEVKKGIQNNIK